MSSLSTGLSNEQKDSLKTIFKAVDCDNSGFVSTEELLQCLRTVQASISMEDVQKLMNEADLDASGTISWDEFLLVMERKLSETVCNRITSGLSRTNCRPTSSALARSRRRQRQKCLNCLTQVAPVS